MKHAERWLPTKFVSIRGRLRASRDGGNVGLGSRLIADLTAERYQVAIERYAHGRLLDLGCGNVPLYGTYKDRVDEVVCVDWENSYHESEHLDFHCDLTKDLPLGDDEFDTLILSDVLEHIPQPELLWREMCRVLRPGGYLLMNVPFYYWIHEEPFDFHRYTEFALRRFVKLVGMHLVSLEAVGGIPEILADITAKSASYVPVIGGVAARLIQWMGGSLRKTAMGKKVSQRTSKRFPIGYFLIAEK
jgi:SAM-dependent methyltransferase